MPIKIDHKGQEFPTQTAMLAFYGVDKHLFRDRLSKGWTLEECLLGKHDTVIDHTGQHFATAIKMCEHWNVNYSTFCNSKRRNLSVEECLLGPKPHIKPAKPIKTKPKITDHMGNQYASLQEMCEYWNISYSVYAHRISIGYSVDNTSECPHVDT